MPEVVVLGAGALGSVYGAGFAAAGCDVTLLTRQAHTEVITRQGLRVDVLGDQRTFDVAATSDPAALPGSADIVMVTAKAHDVGPIVASVRVEPDLVFSVQNGVAKDDLLVERFGRETVVGCVSMVGGTLVAPGHAAYTFSGRTYLGDVAGGPPGGAVTIADLIEASGFLGADVRDDIASVVWSKACLAVAAMGTTGLARLEYHRVFLDDGLANLFIDLVEEAAAVAAAEGVELVDLPGPLQIATLASVPRGEGREIMRAVGEQMVASGQTSIRVSTLQSIDRGRRTEVDAVHRAVLRAAQRHGIDTPVIRTTTRVLEAVDAANLEET